MLFNIKCASINGSTTKFLYEVVKYLTEEENMNRVYFKRTHEMTLNESNFEFKSEYQLWKNKLLNRAFNKISGETESVVKNLSKYILRLNLNNFDINSSSSKVEVSYLEGVIKLFDLFEHTTFKIHHSSKRRRDVIKGSFQNNQNSRK